MTAKQKLKMAEQQLAYWKQVAKEAKAELRAQERVRGKKLRPAKRAVRDWEKMQARQSAAVARVHGRTALKMRKAQRKRAARRR